MSVRSFVRNSLEPFPAIRGTCGSLWRAAMSARLCLLKAMSRRLDFEEAIDLAGSILSNQGFGVNGGFAASGERASFEFVKRTNPLLVDVGGHRGEYTKLFLARFPAGRAIVFEPSATNVAHFRSDFAGASNVTVVQAAIGQRSERAVLYMDADGSALASLTKRRLEHYNIDFALTENIEVRTLDAVAEAHDVDYIDLLKIDVEGHEINVLKGADKLLSESAIGAIQFEFGGTDLDTHTTLQDFFYLLGQHGYAIKRTNA